MVSSACITIGIVAATVATHHDLTPLTVASVATVARAICRFAVFARLYGNEAPCLVIVTCLVSKRPPTRCRERLL